MNYLCRIKLGPVTNLSDARYAAAAGFELIGFRFNPALPGYIPPVKAKEIIDWTTGSGIIGEFGNQGIDEINTICESLDLDIIEVSNDLSPEELKQLAKPVIKNIIVSGDDPDTVAAILSAYQESVDVFSVSDPQQLLFSQTEVLKDLASKFRLLLEISPTQPDPAGFVKAVNPYGICLTGGDEEKAGIKDFDTLDELVEQLSAD